MYKCSGGYSFAKYAKLSIENTFLDRLHGSMVTAPASQVESPGTIEIFRLELNFEYEQKRQESGGFELKLLDWRWGTRRLSKIIFVIFIFFIEHKYWDIQLLVKV